LLTLDIGIIQKIKDVGLNPPVKKDEINSFISLLEKTHVHYKLRAENKKNGIDDSNNPMPVNNQPKSQETKTVQDVKVEQPKKVDSPQKAPQKEEKKVSPKKRRKISKERNTQKRDTQKISPKNTN